MYADAVVTVILRAERDPMPQKGQFDTSASWTSFKCIHGNVFGFQCWIEPVVEVAHTTGQFQVPSTKISELYLLVICKQM